MERRIPRIIVAGTKSKVGKTTITVGLIRALIRRGYNVQPYKVGPDFIDPGFHHLVSGRHSRNLDGFIMPEDAILYTFVKNFNADIAVVEGKTGLYDSSDAISDKGSVAEIAKILKAPVILVVDAERMNRSIAAIVKGYKLFDPGVDIKGVILNRVGNERHAKRVTRAVEELAEIEVVGVIPREKIEMPYRHLGLVTAYERDDIDSIFDRLAEFVEKYVNIDRIVEIAENADPLDLPEFDDFADVEMRDVRFGVLRDRVFSFYYQDNIDLLSRYGRIIEIDSLNSRKLPEIDALIIGGGFPEVFASELEKNRRFRESIYEFCESGNPVYAECGGLMFLGESIEVEGSEYEMVGFLPLETRMNRKFQALGYSVYECVEDCAMAKRGDRIVGHEFHYSKPFLKNEKDISFAFRVLRGEGIDGRRDGIMKSRTLANYIHIHFLSSRKIIRNFVDYVTRSKQG